MHIDAAGEVRRLPLGTLIGARSGDKGGNANVGFWARTDEVWAWLEGYLSLDRFRQLLPEADHLPVERYVFDNLRAINFVVVGLLGEEWPPPPGAIHRPRVSASTFDRGSSISRSTCCPGTKAPAESWGARPGRAEERPMDFIESDEMHMLREAVASIASKFGHDYYVAKARADERTTELWDAVAEAGFLGVNVPEEYGGGGGGISELAAVQEELATAGCPLLVIVVSPAICATVIARFGTEAQRQRWLPRFATGELKMAFAITEPDAGSNSHNLSLTATKDGDLYRLNGSKYYISGVDECEAILVVTRTGIDPDTGRGRLSLFVVDTDTPGLDKHRCSRSRSSPRRSSTPCSSTMPRWRRTGSSARRAKGFARSSSGSIPSASCRRQRPTGSVATRWTRPPTTPRAARCGVLRSAVIRGSPTHWPRPRSKSSWPD